MKYRVTMYNTTYQRDETYITDCESEDLLLESLDLFTMGGFRDIRYEAVPEANEEED